MTSSIAKGLSRITLVALCAIGFTACTPGPDAREGGDYRQNHPLKVGSEPVALTIALPTTGAALNATDRANFKEFLRTFVRRAATPVMVETTQPEIARDVLLQNGLRDGEFIITQNDTMTEPNAILSFAAAKAVSPECGDWSSSSGFTGSNKLHSNFGCSMQRNLGEMIEDPNRLITSSPESGGNASRTDSVIYTHQSGAAKTRLLDGN